MGDVISKIIEKISSYEILNNLLPGAIYVALVNSMTSFNFETGAVWSDLVMIYFIGVVIGRIGSIFIEYAVRKKVSYVPYKEYFKAENRDKKVEELSRINNLYRTFISLIICFCLTFALNLFWDSISNSLFGRLFLILFLGSGMLFIFQKSYKKQAMYVIARVNSVNDNAKEEKENSLQEKNPKNNI